MDTNIKSLNEIANQLGLYQKNDIPQKWRNDNFDHSIDCGKQNIPDGLYLLSGIEFGVFYECKIQDKGTPKEINFIEHSHILVKATNSNLLLMLMKKSYNEDKYRLTPHYSIHHKYQNISHYIREKASKEVEQPNFIGVFTTKKINEWFEYCEKYIQAMEKMYNEVNDKNTEIETKIKSFIDANEGCEVSSYQNITDVTTPLFRVRFTHNKSEKHLNTQIDYTGGLESVTLINNKLKVK